MISYKFSQLVGIQRNTTQHKEKIISAVGGFVSIFFILLITSVFLEINSAGLIVASMGASAVLLFAVPNGPLSQPWPIAGGHLLSAFVGISSYLLIPNILLAASIAVGLSIAVMYYCRCIHPPGGATALSAVVGGAEVHALGYEYLLTPVLYNVFVILLVAVIFNAFFPWRRYPAVLTKKPESKPKMAKTEHSITIPKTDLEFALESMQSFTDISENELNIIYQTAIQHEFRQHLSADEIILGHYYLHGKNNGDGVVRRVIDESADDKDIIIYKVITGADSKKTATTTRKAFAHWARHEVIYKENQWCLK